MALILALGVMMLLAFVWTRALRDNLIARREQRGTWILVGDVLTEKFTVENRSSWPALWAEVRDYSELPGYRPGWVASVSERSSQSYTGEGQCQRRGVFTLGPWELRAGDPLGLFTMVRRYEDTRSILVYPRAMQLPDLHLPRGSAPGPARTTRRTPQFTTQASSVRQYVPGDEMRRIHWRQSAHHDALMVREFDLEPSGDLWLVLDLEEGVHRGEGIESTLEYGVTLAASLATQMLAENRRVGLVAFGQEQVLIPPQAGQYQLWRILEALAHAEPVPELPLDRVLHDAHESIGRGRTVVVITPSTSPAWPVELLHLSRAGNAPAALLLDAASFGGHQEVSGDGYHGQEPGPADAAAMQLLLAEQGVPTHLIDRSFVFRPLYRITRKRTELKTLYGTGRVIAVEVEEQV
jgi:uncharacterized protein (DUF58 family)